MPYSQHKSEASFPVWNQYLKVFLQERFFAVVSNRKQRSEFNRRIDYHDFVQGRADDGETVRFLEKKLTVETDKGKLCFFKTQKDFFVLLDFSTGDGSTKDTIEKIEQHGTVILIAKRDEESSQPNYPHSLFAPTLYNCARSSSAAATAAADFNTISGRTRSKSPSPFTRSSVSSFSSRPVIGGTPTTRSTRSGTPRSTKNRPGTPGLRKRMSSTPRPRRSRQGTPRPTRSRAGTPDNRRSNPSTPGQIQSCQTFGDLSNFDAYGQTYPGYNVSSSTLSQSAGYVGNCLKTGRRGRPTARGRGASSMATCTRNRKAETSFHVKQELDAADVKFGNKLKRRLGTVYLENLAKHTDIDPVQHLLGHR